MELTCKWTKETLINELGYSSKLLCLDLLVDIWNIIGDNGIVQDNYLVVPDNIYESIELYLQKNLDKSKFMVKPWYSYKNNFKIHNGVISITNFSQYQKKAQQDLIAEQLKKQQIEQEKNQKIKEDLALLDDLKKTLNNKWVTNLQIAKNIGTYYDNPFVEYYWTLIQDNYRKADWKDNIELQQDIYNKIMLDTTFQTYKGKNFLRERFTNHKGFSAKITGTYTPLTKEEGGWGIYGIYYHQEDSVVNLVYIGMTNKSFESAWQDHIAAFQGIMPDQLFIHKQGLEIDKIEFRELININNLNFQGDITEKELKAMKLALISLYQPKYNIEGVITPFKI